jgi:WS/DGAT C-terminal domain
MAITVSSPGWPGRPSYAGTLTISAITDPDHFPDHPGLTDALRAELDQITRRRAVRR